MNRSKQPGRKDEQEKTEGTEKTTATAKAPKHEQEQTEGTEKNILKVTPARVPSWLGLLMFWRRASGRGDLERRLRERPWRDELTPEARRKIWSGIVKKL